jgi:predicted TIM-barrel fold metal-dependent hydrolase
MKTPPNLAKFPKNPGTFPATIPALERLLAHNRKARIIWDHGGTDHLGDFSAATVGGLMDRYDNLYVSLKVPGPKAQSVVKLFRAGALDPEWRSLLSRHSDRFVIGTDTFYAGPDGTGVIAEFAKYAQTRLRLTSQFLSLLPAELARKIGRDNALRLYRLSPEQAPNEIPTVATTASPPSPAPVKRAGGTCRDGNMAACTIACQRGFKKACARLKRGN